MSLTSSAVQAPAEEEAEPVAGPAAAPVPEKSSLWTVLRRNPSLFGAVLLLLAPALLDLPGSVSTYLTARWGNTIDAIMAVLGVLVVARVVERWNKSESERADIVRFQRLAEIEFRSLTQAINDARRAVMAPLCGVSLAKASVPGFGEDDHLADLSFLAAAGLEPMPHPRFGIWYLDSALALGDRIGPLARVPGFAEHMFRRASRSRRLMQEAVSRVALVAVGVPHVVHELQDALALSSVFVELQEHWRALDAHGVDDDDARAATVAGTVRALQECDRVLEGLRTRAAVPAGWPTADDA